MPKFLIIFYLRFQSLSVFGGYYVQLFVLWGHVFCRCPVYGGGPYLGESGMKCLTVIIWTDTYTFISLASYIVCTPSPIHSVEFHVHVHVHASFSTEYLVWNNIHGDHCKTSCFILVYRAAINSDFVRIFGFLKS